MISTSSSLAFTAGEVQPDPDETLELVLVRHGEREAIRGADIVALWSPARTANQAQEEEQYYCADKGHEDRPGETTKG